MDQISRQGSNQNNGQNGSNSGGNNQPPGPGLPDKLNSLLNNQIAPNVPSSDGITQLGPVLPAGQRTAPPRTSSDITQLGPIQPSTPAGDAHAQRIGKLGESRGLQAHEARFNGKGGQAEQVLAALRPATELPALLPSQGAEGTRTTPRDGRRAPAPVESGAFVNALRDEINNARPQVLNQIEGDTEGRQTQERPQKAENLREKRLHALEALSKLGDANIPEAARVESAPVATEPPVSEPKQSSPGSGDSYPQPSASGGGGDAGFSLPEANLGGDGGGTGGPPDEDSDSESEPEQEGDEPDNQSDDEDSNGLKNAKDQLDNSKGPESPEGPASPEPPASPPGEPPVPAGAAPEAAAAPGAAGGGAAAPGAAGGVAGGVSCLGITVIVVLILLVLLICYLIFSFVGQIDSVNQTLKDAAAKDTEGQFLKSYNITTATGTLFGSRVDVLGVGTPIKYDFSNNVTDISAYYGFQFNDGAQADIGVINGSKLQAKDIVWRVSIEGIPNSYQYPNDFTAGLGVDGMRSFAYGDPPRNSAFGDNGRTIQSNTKYVCDGQKCLINNNRSEMVKVKFTFKKPIPQREFTNERVYLCVSGDIVTTNLVTNAAVNVPVRKKCIIISTRTGLQIGTYSPVLDNSSNTQDDGNINPTIPGDPATGAVCPMGLFGPVTVCNFNFVSNDKANHPAIDIYNGRTNDIYAPVSGKIVYVAVPDEEWACGSAIAIQANNLYYYVGHFYSPGKYKVGDPVKAGDRLGSYYDFVRNRISLDPRYKNYNINPVTRTPCWSGKHIHFGIYKELNFKDINRAIDPKPFINKTCTAQLKC